MDRAVFDTNILIHYTHDHPGAVSAILGCSHRIISLTTWIEFLVGISVVQRPQYEEFLRKNFEIVEIDLEIANYVIDIRRSKKLKLPDATIYATAKCLRVPLITANSKDFGGVDPDILIPYEVKQ